MTEQAPRTLTAATLNARQAKFVDAYLEHGIAKKAAVEAGYSTKNAESISSQLLKKTQVAAAIAQRQRRAMEAADVTFERIVYELACIGFADIGDAAEWHSDRVRMFPTALMPEHARRAIAAVEQTEQGVRVRQHDKLAALRELEKLHPQFRERLEVEHHGLASIFDAVRRRALERCSLAAGVNDPVEVLESPS